MSKRPDWFFNHHLLAACQAAAGNLRRAGEAMTEARRQMPSYSMTTLKVGHPFADAMHLDRYVQALKQAGWSGA